MRKLAGVLPTGRRWGWLAGEEAADVAGTATVHNVAGGADVAATHRTAEDRLGADAGVVATLAAEGEGMAVVIEEGVAAIFEHTVDAGDDAPNLHLGRAPSAAFS